MSDNKKGINSQGIFYNRPNQKAPDFVLGNLAIDVEKFIKWLLEQERTKTGYVHLQILTSRDSQGEEFLYLKYNQWLHDYETHSKGAPAKYGKKREKRTVNEQPDVANGGDDDLPF